MKTEAEKSLSTSASSISQTGLLFPSGKGPRFPCSDDLFVILVLELECMTVNCRNLKDSRHLFKWYAS